MSGESLPADLAPQEYAWAAGTDGGRVGGRAHLPLETKLYPPGVRREWVERQELIRRLAGSRASLVLVNAPAGFGKTILVAQWRASAIESRPFAWVSLDSGDNDPVRLWRHVASALARTSPAGIEGALGALAFPVPDIAGAFLPLLVNELAILRARVVLVLDDYHAITERGCRNQVMFLLRHLPPGLQVVLITRTEQGLPLGRLRAAGDFTEVRMEDLRFSEREAGAVVDSVAHVTLTAPDLADLTQRTEGWPAGVYLAALSLRDHQSPGAFIRQFTGSHRYIVDFLLEEVVGRQPARIREFLVRTAILSRFTPPLCDAVTGSGDAAEILEILERDNLFLVALDDERRWFRYHQLFAQMLHSQLARTEPGLLPVLHARASAWHRDTGSMDDAVAHALAGGDVAVAVRLISEHWHDYVSAGRVATVNAWTRSLGADRIRTIPVAAHCAAWAAGFSGDRDCVRRWLPVVEAARYEGPLPDGMRSLSSSAALLRAAFGFVSIRVKLRSAEEAVRLEDDPASPWYALARASLGWSLYLSGAVSRAQAPLEEALLATALTSLARMFSLSILALIALEAGRVPQAEALARAAREMAASGRPGDTPHTALAHTAIGAVYARQGRLEEARREFEGALRRRVQWFGVSPWMTVEAQFGLADVMVELGDRAAAVALLGEISGALRAMPEGADALRARLERLERRCAAAVARPEDPVVPLTEQERRILPLLRSTLTRREIAEELHVSMNTVKTHVRMIHRKLGVSSRQETVRRARELGLLCLYLALLGVTACPGRAVAPPEGSAGLRLDQLEMPGGAHRLVPAGDPELPEDALEMALDGVDRDVHLLRDLGGPQQL